MAGREPCGDIGMADAPPTQRNMPLTATGHGRNLPLMRRRHRTVVVVLLLALGVVACGGAAVSLSPDSATPREILTTYLTALVAGDCEVGRALAASAFADGSGDLCGETDVTTFGILGEPAEPRDGEVVFTTHLVTSGTGDGTVPPGGITWFFDLQRTSTGPWRLDGGGSGP